MSLRKQYIEKAFYYTEEGFLKTPCGDVVNTSKEGLVKVGSDDCIDCQHFKSICIAKQIVKCESLAVSKGIDGTALGDVAEYTKKNLYWTPEWVKSSDLCSLQHL